MKDDKNQPTKWQLILAELKGYGITQVAVAEHCCVSQAAIHQLKKGLTKEPYHSHGEMIIGLLESQKAARSN